MSPDPYFPEALMWLRARSKTALCLSVVSFLFTPAIAKHQEATAIRLPAHRVAVEHLTCDRSVIDSISYEMATVGQAQTLLSHSTVDNLNGDIPSTKRQPVVRPCRSSR